MADQRTCHGVPHRVTCRALGVWEAWFYNWHDRERTARELRRVVLCKRVTKLFDASGKTYGSPRIHQDLAAEGWAVSVNTVAHLMAELGLSGRKKPKRHGSTRPGKRPVARDLVRRNFDAVAPDVLWCGDMTEIVTAEGRIWCASVIDLFSRRLLGHALGEHHDAQLVGAALQMAVAARGGNVDGVIFHSDRGSEYTSAWFNELCARLGVVQSMGRVGSALDNAVSESFNSALKVEFVHRNAFATRAEARLRIATWIADFYNTRRRHSAAGALAPTEFERIMKERRSSRDHHAAVAA
ncbi:MAG: IS3 family transposase [Sciscionella sp.]